MPKWTFPSRRADSSVFRPDNAILTPGHPLWDGCQLALLGQHAGGSTAYDSSPFQNNGTLTNMDSTNWGTASDRNTLAFNGTDEYVTTTCTSPLLTLAMYAQVNAGNPQHRALATKESGFNLTYSFLLGTKNYAETLTLVEHSAGINIESASSISANVPFHVALVSGVGMYFDGSLSKGAAIATAMRMSLAANAFPLWIARNANYYGSYWPGRIWDVTAWDRALTASEIATLASSDPMYDGALWVPSSRLTFWTGAGGTEETASVSPLVVTLTIPAVTATWESEQTASVSPVAVTATIPSVTATWESEQTASVSPLAVTATIPAVTAQYESEQTASVAPVAVSVTIPAVTATWESEQSASVSPVAVTATIPAVTATWESEQTASVSPLAVTITLPAVTASYESEQSASVSPLSVTITLPAVTGTWESEQTASVSPLAVTITIPAVTATYSTGVVATSAVVLIRSRRTPDPFTLHDIDYSQPLDTEHLHAQGLVGFWKVLPDWRGKSRWFDLSMYGNHGTLTGYGAGDTRFTAGRRGLGALSFDGVDDYVQCANFSPGPNDLTLCCWLYTSNASQFGIISQTRESGGGVNHLWSVDVSENSWAGSSGKKIGATVISNGTGNTRSYNTSSNVIDGGDHYVVVTWTNASSGIKIFIDGDERSLVQNESAGSIVSIDSDGPTRIGTNVSGAAHLSGLLDDVRIYNRALTATEVADQYEDGLTGKYELLRRVNRNVFWSLGASTAGTTKRWPWQIRRSRRMAGAR